MLITHYDRVPHANLQLCSHFASSASVVERQPASRALNLLQEGKLTASEGLGDLYKTANDWDTALDIYRQAGAANKVVEALAAKGDFEQLATFTRSSGNS